MNDVKKVLMQLAEDIRRMHPKASKDGIAARVEVIADELYTTPQPDKWIPEGWKLVPEKPSLSMCEAGCCVPCRQHQSEGDWMSEIYLAMLDAAPTPPEQESE